MKITTKENWEEVTLRDFLAINEANESKEFRDTVIAKRIKMVSIVSNASYDDLMGIDSESLEKLIQATRFLDTVPTERESKTFMIEGREYSIVQDLNKMTAGESISLEQLLINKAEGGSDIISDILSILIRPSVNGVVDKFDEKLIEERKTFFLDYLTVPCFMGFLTTLLVGGTSLENLIQRYSIAR